MNKKRKHNRYMKRYPFPVALLGAFFLVCGCSTLPFPHTPTESLLVVSYEIEADLEDMGKEITELTLLFSRNSEDNGVIPFSLHLSGKKDTMKMEPGEYTLDSAELRIREDKLFGKTETETVPIDRPLVVGTRSIHLLDAKLIVNAGGDRGYELRLDDFSGEDAKTAVYLSLMRDKRWPVWERYDTANFPDDVESQAEAMLAAEEDETTSEE